MAINRRGAILLVATTLGFAASLTLVWPRRRIATSPPAPQPAAEPRDAASDAKVTLNSKEHRALCDGLAARYKAAVETAALGCARDEDCAAEERGGVFLELDGCGRFGLKNASYQRADPIAAEWAKSACSFAPDITTDCGGVFAKCERTRCVERAPEPLPRDWKRLSLRGAVSVFAPPDFVETDLQGDDTLVRVFDGKDRSLALKLDLYGSPVVDAALHPHFEVVDGERAQVYFVDHGVDAGAQRYEAGIVFERHWSEFFLSGGYLSMRLDCASLSACADRDAIFRGARVLLQNVEIARDH